MIFIPNHFFYFQQQNITFFLRDQKQTFFSWDVTEKLFFWDMFSLIDLAAGIIFHAHSSVPV